MKFSKFTSVFALAAMSALALASAPALAEGYYAGASLGQSKITVDGYTGSETMSGGKVFGGYTLNPNFSVELGYANLGKKSYSAFNGTIKAYSVFGDIVGTLPLGANFDLLGRVGVASTHASSSLAGSDNSTNVKLGVGVQYNFNPKMAVRAEWEQYKADLSGSNYKAGVTSIGLSYKF